MLRALKIEEKRNEKNNPINIFCHPVSYKYGCTGKERSKAERAQRHQIQRICNVTVPIQRPGKQGEQHVQYTHGAYVTRRKTDDRLLLEGAIASQRQHLGPRQFATHGGRLRRMAEVRCVQDKSRSVQAAVHF